MSNQGKFAAELLDPEFAAILSELPDFVFNEESLSITRDLMPGPSPPADDVERSDHVVDEGPVVVTINRPKTASNPLPCVVWMHGGGTIIGNRHLDDAQLQRWCRSLGLCSVSVEYRLAPEHPFPVPLEDCYQALSWAVAHADDLGIDPSRIGVGGKSAGALLAASLALLVRERGGPPIRCQILDCPMLDDRQRTPSSQLEGVPLWSRESNAFGWRCYLGAALRDRGCAGDRGPNAGHRSHRTAASLRGGRRTGRLAGRGCRVPRPGSTRPTSPRNCTSIRASLTARPCSRGSR